tara:strand:+ start:77 stop:916 length:840 start_codon:yes stop_codon:yes gene_type:complete
MKIYIQTNNQQRLAAKIAKASFVKNGFDINNIFFLDLEKNDFLKSYLHKDYLRNGLITKYKNDLQSFTLLRFFAPEMNAFKDKILVIDPDVFACKNPNSIFSTLNSDDEICCTFYNNLPRSEVMVIDASKVRWDFKQIIKDLFDKKIDYKNLMNLSFNKNIKIKQIDNIYNSHDKIDKNTILLHTTNRISQPWKEGLKIDFEKNFSLKNKMINFLKKKIGEPYNPEVLTEIYIRHPNETVINTIKTFYNFALQNNIINFTEINEAIKKGYFSKKFITES